MQLTKEELRSYFTSPRSGADRRDRPEIFRERLEAAYRIDGGSLARELVKTSGIFANAVAQQFGIQAYRTLQDRDPNKSPALLATEAFLRQQGQEPRQSQPLPGNHPDAFKVEPRVKREPIAPPPISPKASDNLRGIAGVKDENATVNDCIDQMHGDSKDSAKTK